MTTQARLPGRRLSRPALTVRRVGSITIVALVLLALGLYFKAPIATTLRGGTTVQAAFDANYQIIEDKTKVKSAGLEVGIVTDVEREDDGSLLVSMKIDDDVVDHLGSDPSVQIAPKTILGGEYALEVTPGGEAGRPSGVIPADRTEVPVELDRILETLPKPTRAGLQSTIAQLDKALEGDAAPALGEFTEDIPAPFVAGGDVLLALRGTRPATDLQQAIKGLDGLATALSDRVEDLDAGLGSTRQVTGTLARRTGALQSALDAMPGALSSTRTGMAALSATLTQLEQTSPKLLATADALDPLLADLEPTLRKTRPLLDRLRPVIADARPVVDQLVPTVRDVDQVLADLRGPVLDRVNGPILDTVMNTWRGSGPYANSGGGVQGDHTFYEEVGYLVANMDRASMTQDAQGSLLSFQVGVSESILSGLPFTMPTLLKTFGGAR